MIKVQNNTATREPIPSFLDGLAADSLADLSWTDPQLDVSDCAWWPEEDRSPALKEFERYGAETLTLDHERKVVVVTREVEQWSQEEIDAHIESIRSSLITRNNEAYESAILQMTSDYPAAEIQTWERQREEALAWAEDTSAETPWIDLAAQARNLDRNEYLTRTLAKVNAFAQASAWLTGRRQGIDDAIRSAKTIESLNSIEIDYSLPQQ